MEQITYGQLLKKQMEKKKRIRKRRIKVYLCRIVLTCFLIIIFTGIINLFNYKNEKEKYETFSPDSKEEFYNSKSSAKAISKRIEQLAQMGYNREILEKLFELSKKNETIVQILNNIENYPEALLELLSKNPETIDFVRDYKKSSIESEIQEGIDISDLYSPRKIPFFLQWDTRWGYCQYGDNYIAISGCGPTCLSMVYVGLTGDTSKNPGVMSSFSEENGFLDSDNNTVWAFMTNGAKMLGLNSREISLSEDVMINELAQGHPIILSMRPGDFTATGHFIVISEYKNGKFVVHDPNSKIRSKKLWDFDSLSHQIKNLWAFSI